jgi:excisionase family DNA binding protein
MQPTLDLPNPEAWCDARQAAKLLGVGRATLYGMIDRGVLGDYKVGTARLFWRADLVRLAAARAVVSGRHA